MSEVNDVKGRKTKDRRKSKGAILFSILLYHNTSATTHAHVQHIHLEQKGFCLFNFEYIYIYIYVYVYILYFFMLYELLLIK